MQLTKTLCTLVAGAWYGTSSPAPDDSSSTLLMAPVPSQCHGSSCLAGEPSNRELTLVQRQASMLHDNRAKDSVDGSKRVAVEAATLAVGVSKCLPIDIGGCNDGKIDKYFLDDGIFHPAIAPGPPDGCCKSTAWMPEGYCGFAERYRRQAYRCDGLTSAPTTIAPTTNAPTPTSRPTNVPTTLSPTTSWPTSATPQVYVRTGIGECSDENGQRSKLGYRTNRGETLADCEGHCNAVPNCQAFSLPTIDKNWCALWSVGGFSRGEQTDLTCYSKVTKASQALVYGNWNVKRMHATWNHLTRDDSVCGKNTDVLSIGSVNSKWCKNKHGSDGQAIVNQDGAELSFAWFCSNQGTTTIVGTPTFVPEEGDGPCAHQHQVDDQGN